MLEHIKRSSVVEKKYPIVIAIILEFIIVVFFRNFYKSKNFISALEVAITFVTIIVGLYSTVLPIAFSMKEENSLFEQILGERRYKRFLKSSILSGVLVILISFLLIFNDLFCENIFCAFANVWSFILIFFILCTFRVTSITIDLLLSAVYDSKNKKEEKHDYGHIDEFYKK